ncbi:MAG TPA: hypothetical protein PKH58_12195 [Paludibacteraceae bacterium]|nr:hypothetical protein [Paludibacteraceae bacterium]
MQMKIGFLLGLLLIGSCSGNTNKQSLRRPLYEHSFAFEKDLPKQVIDKYGLATPRPPEMCFWDEYAGLTENDLIQRFGRPNNLDTIKIDEINFVGTHTLLADKKFIIQERGGKIDMAKWTQGEWKLTAYFWPSTKTCLGSVRRHKSVEL